MEQLAKDGRIVYLEFFNEDGMWWSDDVWMFGDSNVGALMHKTNDLSISDEPFVIECAELKHVNGVYYCEATVQPIKTPYNRKTYERNPAYKSMETSVRIEVKRPYGGVILVGVAGLAVLIIWRQFKK